ncbi:MAG TPA: N-acetylneuraminate synthase family protein [Solirubrobacteraceae bacterium]|nr:N-acetylneuraminate synthase family protein [Solirubrobacteraceae bacterium]
MTRFIAELGSNHNRDLDRALALLDAAARAGAGAVKLQVFHVEDLFAPEVLAVREDLRARSAWELPLELLEPIARRCRELEVELGATPFGLWAIEALQPHVDFFKVASYELLWHELIEKLAETGKPLVISAGMATLPELDAAVAAAREAGCHELRLLHCVSGYPTPPEQCNLAAIAALRERYGCPVGWSDHSARAEVVRRAVRHWGASDVELHVDLDGSGHEAGEHNWTPDRLSALIASLEDPGREPESAVALDGNGVKRPMPIEAPDVAWRADPSDGLRPLLATRATLRQKQ